jgi:hypothetical protein
MYVEGFDRPLLYATQLPDTTEPRTDGNITGFLSQFGRGDWFNSPRNSTSTILQVLFLMNDNQIMARTLASRDNSRSTRVATLLATNMSEDDMVQQLFLSTLGRPPTDDEKAALQRNRSTSSTSCSTTEDQTCENGLISVNLRGGNSWPALPVWVP